MTVTTSRLPDHTRLRAGATQMRSAADLLSTRERLIRGFASAIGPGFWVDSSSQHAKHALESIAGELGGGRRAINDAAQALEHVARVVSGKRVRHLQIEARLLELRGQAGPQTAAEIIHLTQERQAIERAVDAAMRHAAQTVDSCAARANRHENRVKDSVLGFFKGIGDGAMWVGKTAVDFAKGVGRVLDGAWDATWELGKTVIDLGRFAARFSPPRFILDRDGYMRDARELADGVGQFAQAVVEDPIGVARELGKAVIDWDDMVNDPLHWVGGLVPSIVAGLATGGGGVAVKGAGAAGKVSRAGNSLAGVAALPINRGFKDLLVNGVDIRRWEGVSGANGSPAHIAERHINQSGLSNVEALKSWTSDQGRRRPLESIFNSENEANIAIRHALEGHAVEIQRWLDSPSLAKKDDVVQVFDRQIGLSMAKGQPEVYSVNSVQLVLRKSESAAEGFIVQTAYPLYNSPVRIPISR